MTDPCGVPVEICPSAPAHDVHSVHDGHLGGSADVQVLEACLTGRGWLGTLDLDFSDIRRYPPADQMGIRVLRADTSAGPMPAR